MSSPFRFGRKNKKQFIWGNNLVFNFCVAVSKSLTFVSYKYYKVHRKKKLLNLCTCLEIWTFCIAHKKCQTKIEHWDAIWDKLSPASTNLRVESRTAHLHLETIRFLSGHPLVPWGTSSSVDREKTSSLNPPT